MFDESVMLDTLRNIDRYKSEFAGVDVRNDYFGPVDAEVYYAFIRHFMPDLIVEVGSGYSTIVASKAIDNSVHRTILSAIDPAPRTVIPSRHGAHYPELVQNMPTEFFDSLESDDFLFIDSSHVFRSGNDVDYLYNRVLPSLNPGVMVHIHDIFLPDQYPNWAHWLTFNEADLVREALDSGEYDVLWSSHYMHTHFPSELSKTFKSYNPRLRPGPGSLWMVKR